MLRVPTKAGRRRSLRTLFVLVLLASPKPVLAQWHGYPVPDIPRAPDGEPMLDGPTPRTPDGKPDLTGLWLYSGGGGFGGSVALEDIAPGCCLPNVVRLGQPGVPAQPWVQALVDQRAADFFKDDPNSSCLPSGLAIKWVVNTPTKIVQTPAVTVLLFESKTTFRQVFTDGRPLPEVDWPTWQGYSVGHWEGDVFVIETTGFNDRTRINRAYPVTNQMKMTERLRRPNLGSLELEITFDDPGAYTEPWTISATHSLQTDTEILEFTCLENEKDADPSISVGNTSVP